MTPAPTGIDTEPGSASVLIDLTGGEISVVHGTDHVELRRWRARRGDWDRLWQTIDRLAEEAS